RWRVERTDDLYLQIVESSTDGFWVIDGDGVTHFASARLGEILRRDPAEMVGTPMSDYLDEVGQQQFAVHLAALRRGELNRTEVECCFLRGDGTQVWATLSESLLDTPGEEPLYLHRITDSTAQRELLAEISRNRAQLAEAQRIGRIGGFVWQPRADSTWWSEEMFRIFRLEDQQPPASWEAFLQLIDPRDREVVDASIRDVADDNVVSWYARLHTGAATDVVWLHGRGVVETDEDGRITMLRGTVQDQTAERETED